MRPRLWIRLVGLGCLLALGAVVLPSAATAATPLAVVVAPDVATWRDQVTVTVTGDGCGAALASPDLQLSPPRIRLRVLSSCGAHDAPAPFRLSTTLSALQPASYQVLVEDDETQESVTSTLVIDIPATPVILVPSDATSERSTTVHVVGLGSCPFAELASRVGNVIELRGGLDCNFDPPLGFVRPFDLPVDVGKLAPGDYEVRMKMVEAFSGGIASARLHVRPAGSCTPSDTALCLRDGRFRVAATWKDFSAHTGVGHPAAGEGQSSGLLWFFSPDKVELTVKVLDGCAITGTHWLFLSSSSTVEYEVTVTDTLTGVEAHIANDAGQQQALRTDLTTFPCS